MKAYLLNFKTLAAIALWQPANGLLVSNDDLMVALSRPGIQIILKIN